LKEEEAMPEAQLKQRLLRELGELPPDKLIEVLDFAAFLKSRAAQEEIRRSAPSLPASSLDTLTDLVAWGGDALVDAEHLYDESL